MIRQHETLKDAWSFTHALEGTLYHLQDIPKRKLEYTVLAMNKYVKLKTTASVGWIADRIISIQ